MPRKKSKDTLTRSVQTTSRWLNTGKLEAIKAIDERVHVTKNVMSKFAFDNRKELVSMGAQKFGNEYYKREEFDCGITAWERQRLFTSICQDYINMYERHIKNVKFDVQYDFRVERYKRNTKNNKKGDIKERHLLKRPCLIYKLMRGLMYVFDYNNIRYKDYKFQFESYSEEKQAMIISIVERRKEQVFNNMKCIDYKDGSYEKDGYTTSSKKETCLCNDDSNSLFKEWYLYKRPNNEYIPVPVQINKKYHKDMYNRAAIHTVRVVGNRFDVLTSKEVEKPKFNPVCEIVGVDINVVNNFITCSDGQVFDYDREYLTSMYKMMKKINSIGYDNLSKNMKRQYDKLVRRNEWYFKRIIHDVLMYFAANGQFDVVMEDLNFKDKSWIVDEETGLKYSQIVRLLHLSNIKNWLKSQAEKLGIRVHLTPSHYTSQQCPVCGHIDRDNRTAQEKFECKNCGHADNADHNASVNIKHRFTGDVLRKSKQIHSFDEYGRMIPCSKNKTIIKKVLLSVFDT